MCVAWDKCVIVDIVVDLSGGVVHCRCKQVGSRTRRTGLGWTNETIRSGSVGMEKRIALVPRRCPPIARQGGWYEYWTMDVACPQKRHERPRMFHCTRYCMTKPYGAWFGCVCVWGPGRYYGTRCKE